MPLWRAPSEGTALVTLSRSPIEGLQPRRGGVAFPVPVTWYLWQLPGSDHELENGLSGT
jgi:hypothetical protein